LLIPAWLDWFGVHVLHRLTGRILKVKHAALGGSTSPADT
jgi:hypothetical protein